MKRTEPVPEKKVYVIIRRNWRKTDRLETWRFWEILGALRWLGLDYLTAYDLAKWCRRALPGDSREPVLGITLEVSG